MKNQELMAALIEIQKEIKEIRQHDIPNLRVDTAEIREKAKNEAKSVALVTGGLSAVMVGVVVESVKRLFH